MYTLIYHKFYRTGINGVINKFFFFVYLKAKGPCTDFFLNIESVFRKALGYEERIIFVYLQFKSGFHI